MRIVLDTNIYIAAALRSGFSADVLQVIGIVSQFETIISEAILKELREKLQEKFNWPQNNIEQVVERIVKLAQIVEVKEKISIITRDLEDNKILECAVAGEADLIVSLDQDLIKLKNFRGIAIIHPKTFTWTFPQYFKKKQN